MRRPLVVVLLPALVLLPGPPPARAEPAAAALEDLPSARPEDVTRLLRKIRRRHGEDAIVVQTQLLLNAMRQGSVRATGVRVEDVEEAFGRRYLRFVVETGMVFDDATRDRQARAQILWANVVEPTLARLEDGLQVDADGMLVQLEYHHRPYRSVAELRSDLDRPGTAEVARFHVLASDLDAVMRRDLTLRALLGRTRPTIDGAEISVAPPRDDQPLTPGPS